VVHRRVPAMTAVFLLSAAITYLACGRSVAALPWFLGMQAEIVRGYSEAMGFYGSRLELILFMLISASVAVIVLCLERTSRGDDRISSALRVAGLCAFWLLVFKAGFVRQDMHTLIAWQAVGMAALVYAFSQTWPPAGGRRCALFFLLATGIAMVAVAAPLRRATLEGGPPYAARLLHIYELVLRNPIAQWSAIVEFVSDPARWQTDAAAAKEHAWTALRRARLLPILEGTVDIIPSEQGAVLANGLNYVPRPIFQEYATYTRRLIESDAAF